MTLAHVDTIDRSVEKAHIRLKDLAEELGGPDQRYADSFLAQIAASAGLAGETEASFAAGAASKVLQRRVSRGRVTASCTHSPSTCVRS